ncbi:hypothetical protein KCP78_21050 [Salmonella enterica subsp. enterica]|nr:hypothetical protein KCP78_21050 [Salmonella enterica subsp. enterica]
MKRGVRYCNTSGAKTAEEAIFARPTGAGKRWRHKLVEIRNPSGLPAGYCRTIETLKAAGRAGEAGFCGALPYCGADPVLCRSGWKRSAARGGDRRAYPGSNQGWKPKRCWKYYPADDRAGDWLMRALACPAMPLKLLEMGADAVLVNTAIAVADDPVMMAAAFPRR